jgi:undecaprenyl-diphosphatase
VNGFDQAIFDAMGRFAGKNPGFDLAVGQWVRAEIVGKGDVALALFWGVWFLPREPRRDRREVLIATAIAGALAVLAGRGIGLAFPFRLRPIHAPSLQFILPYGARDTALRGWSSFPSDHAMVWAAIATGVGTVAPIAGWIIAFVTLALVCLPRVYLGLHYPTDIVGGYLIGAIIAWAFTHGRARTTLARPLLALEERAPHVFYAAAFFASLHLADMFVQLRAVLRLIKGVPV